MWRVDTPSEDVIVAKLTADFCGGKARYAILYLGTQKVLGGSCVCYMEDGEEIPYSAIEKWALLEGAEINGDLESEDLSDLIDKLSKRYPEVSFAKLARIVVAATKWQKSQEQQTIELAEEHAMLAGMMQERERLMKDAVDGWVARDKDCDIAIFREVPTKDAEIGMWKPCKSAYIFPNKDEYPDVTWDSEPQKVKVIIIKE